MKTLNRILDIGVLFAFLTWIPSGFFLFYASLDPVVSSPVRYVMILVGMFFSSVGAFVSINGFLKEIRKWVK